MKSKHEAKFGLLWRALNGPKLAREFRFHATRKWRADFAHLPTKTLLELDGGMWAMGRHNRGSGYGADRERDLAAWLDGWSTVRLVPAQINGGNLAAIIGRLNDLEYGAFTPTHHHD